MNRLFGTSRAKGPAPNLTDSIANIDARGDSVEKKIQKLDVSFRHNIDIIIIRMCIGSFEKCMHAKKGLTIMNPE